MLLAISPANTPSSPPAAGFPRPSPKATCLGCRILGRQSLPPPPASPRHRRPRSSLQQSPLRKKQLVPRASPAALPAAARGDQWLTQRRRPAEHGAQKQKTMLPHMCMFPENFYSLQRILQRTCGKYGTPSGRGACVRVEGRGAALAASLPASASVLRSSGRGSGRRAQWR